MRLGKMQYAILQFLHQDGPATARAITEAMSQATPVAHSTVQTLMRQLEAKNLVAHEKQERTFVFRALRAPDEATHTPLRDLLARVYQGSVYSLMAHLLQQENVSPEEKERLHRLLDKEDEK